jgi:hypothetical protein
MLTGRTSISSPFLPRVGSASEPHSSPRPGTPPGEAAATPGDTRIKPFGTRNFLELLTKPRNPVSDTRWAKKFGNHVTVYCSPGSEVRDPHNEHRLPEPSKDAMELAYKFCGAKSQTIVSSTKSPHLLDYLPPIANITHSTTLDPSAQSTSIFVLNTTLDEMKEMVEKLPENTRVIISNNASKSVAQQVAYLGHHRPDLQVYGHASSLHDPSNSKGAIEAFRQVGTILDGKTAVVTRALNAGDSAWISKETGHEVSAGTAIPAVFDKQGNLDRNSFSAFFESERNETFQNLKKSVEIYNELELPTAVNSDKDSFESPRKATAFSSTGNVGSAITEVFSGKTPDIFKTLGKVMVFGSTGNVGSAITEFCSGKTPAYAMKRDVAKSPVDYLGNAKNPVFEIKEEGIPEGIVPDTVFLTASAPRPKDKDGKIIVDRAAMLGANLEQILIPTIRKLPQEVKLIQVITNPCSDMAYAAWLLRPDLTGKIYGHSGTDMVRQEQHVTKPSNKSTYFTFGPHSPGQVNVDLAAKNIDPDLPVKGNDIARRSGGQPATDPTALSSIMEAINLTRKVPSSYAIPLTAEEATQLTDFLNSLPPTGKPPVQIHEGLAITIPRKGNGKINWRTLDKAKDNVPGFAEKAIEAAVELESGRKQVLDKIADLVERKNPELSREINHDWILENRHQLLNLLRTAPSQSQSTN